MKPCTFCTRPATYGPFHGETACAPCARRVADAARKGDREVWASGKNAEDSLQKFEASVSAQLPTDGAESYLQIAEAYRQMNFYEHAVRAAGNALASAQRAKVIEASLVLLLTPPLLRTNGLAALKRRVLAS